MLVKETVYNILLLTFVVSITLLLYSIINKNKKICKYIIILSFLYMGYLLFGLFFVQDFLDLSIGLEILIFYPISLLSILFYILSFVIAIIKSKKMKPSKIQLMVIIIFTFLLLIPPLILGVSYYREKKYINNSKLILICSKGEEFSQEYFAYAINDNYTEKITIGSDFGGYHMYKYLPSFFRELNYTWTTDEVKISKDKIIIYRNDEIIYQNKLIAQNIDCKVEEIFYKEN